VEKGGKCSVTNPQIFGEEASKNISSGELRRIKKPERVVESWRWNPTKTKNNPGKRKDSCKWEITKGELGLLRRNETIGGGRAFNPRRTEKTRTPQKWWQTTWKTNSGRTIERNADRKTTRQKKKSRRTNHLAANIETKEQTGTMRLHLRRKSPRVRVRIAKPSRGKGRQKGTHAKKNA